MRFCAGRAYRAKHVVLKPILRVANDFLIIVGPLGPGSHSSVKSSPLMALADATRSRTDLTAENAMLRQQLIISTRPARDASVRNASATATSRMLGYAARLES
mgnify:CR=1 FL=1